MSQLTQSLAHSVSVVTFCYHYMQRHLRSDGNPPLFLTVIILIMIYSSDSFL